MSTQDLNKALSNLANSDLRIARSKGVVVVTDTKQGNVEITYDQAAKTYTMKNFNDGKLLMSGPAGAARELLVALYCVQNG